MWRVRSRMSAHALIGVSPEATTAEVRAAYRRRAQLLHPDRNPERVAEATREFQALTQAYRELTRADGPVRREWSSTEEPGEKVGAFWSKSKARPRSQEEEERRRKVALALICVPSLFLWQVMLNAGVGWII